MKPLTTALLLAFAATATLSAQDATPKPPAVSQPASGSTPISSQVSTQSFVFNGGSFYDFVNALRKTYGTNALELFEFPEERITFRVPRMRVPGDSSNIRAVFYLYNETSRAGDYYLGKWAVLPANTQGLADTSLRALSFLPPKLASPGSGSGIAVRAFSIGRFTPAEQKDLREIVEAESRRLRDYIEVGRYGRQDPSEATGNISLHEGSGLLVATGGKAYVELVGSVVEAFEKRRPSLTKP